MATRLSPSLASACRSPGSTVRRETTRVSSRLPGNCSVFDWRSIPVIRETVVYTMPATATYPSEGSRGTRGIENEVAGGGHHIDATLDDLLACFHDIGLLLREAASRRVVPYVIDRIHREVVHITLVSQGIANEHQPISVSEAIHSP